VSSGADIRATDALGRLPMHYLRGRLTKYSQPRLPILALFLSAGVEVDVRDGRGRTPLWESARLGDCVFVSAYIKAGADVNALDPSGRTPLHAVLRPSVMLPARRTAVVRLLLDAGTDVNAATPDGVTPLHLAAENGYTESLRLLLEHGADRSLQTQEGHTPLDLARRAGQEDAVHMLTADDH